MVMSFHSQQQEEKKRFLEALRKREAEQQTEKDQRFEKAVAEMKSVREFKNQQDQQERDNAVPSLHLNNTRYALAGGGSVFLVVSKNGEDVVLELTDKQYQKLSRMGVEEYC